jgi:hypothetical protein
MKKLLLLILLCAIPANLFAQWLEKPSLPHDSITISPPQPVILRPPQIVILRQYLPSGNIPQWRTLSLNDSNVMLIRQHVVILRPPRIIIRQKCVRYYSQIIFVERPQVTIQPAQIAFK